MPVKKSVRTSALLMFLIFTLTTVTATAQDDIINGEIISEEFPFESNYVEVLGSQMHYIDEGEGDPILFIHGNPTSSYLWRNVVPHVTGNYRAIAVDLIGMGKSEKPDIGYTYLDHRRYVNGFIETLDLENITFVIHDWGSVLGFDYAMNNESNTVGIAFMEAIIPPRMPQAEEPEPNSIFGQLRTQGAGEKLVYEEHHFVEELLPGSVVRELTETEMDHYREPFKNEGSRKPILQWPRELPMGGTPATNADIITQIGEWMKETDIPMLHFWARPGALNPESAAQYFVENVKNIESQFIGDGRHYLQEDHPEIIGRTVNDWRRRVGKR